MRPLMLALALAGSLTLAVPALPAAAADTSSTAIEAAESAVERARRDMRAEFRAPPANGRYVWKDGAGDVTRVVLDLSRQLAFAYDGGELIAVSTISSGDADHLSPVGVFPIMEKKRHHRSNRYNDAPMPYMQRLNEWGVAARQCPSRRPLASRRPDARAGPHRGLDLRRRLTHGAALALPHRFAT